MGHPDYVYRPCPDERRARMSASHRARLGIPDGHRRVAGVDFPDEVAERLAPILWGIARYPGTYEIAHEAAIQFLERGIWALRPYMRDTPQWTRARIQRRRLRLMVQRRAEERVKASVFAALHRMEEKALLAEEALMEREKRDGR